jgi:heavy metal sensor kinase
MLLGLGILMAAFGTIIYTAIAHSLYSQLDSRLKSTAQVMTTAVEQDGSRIKTEFDVSLAPRFSDSTHPDFYLVCDRDTDLLKSPLLEQSDANALKTALAGHSIRNVHVNKGRYVRAIAITFKPKLEHGSQADAKDLLFILAQNTRDLRSQLESLFWLLMLSGTVILILALAAAYIIVRSGLKPLSTMAHQISLVDASDLSQRFDLAAAPSELLVVARQLNSMIARLQDSFSREKRLNSDIAHELRTPLSGLQSTLEVALLRPRNDADYKSALASSLVITREMQSIIESLLMISRLDNNQVSFNLEAIDIRKAFDNFIDDQVPKVAAKNITIDNRLTPGLLCSFDSACFKIIIKNLVENALEYTNPAGRIEIFALNKDGKFELSVSNTGSRLQPGQLDHIFESFWRGDSARSETGTHCGLGLAIVKRIVDSAGARIYARLGPGDLFTITLLLPASHLPL